MEINWKNLITRTISGAVLVLLIVCAVVFGTVSVYSKILFGVLFSFIMVVCQKEFLNITTKENASINIFFAIIPSLFLLWGTVLDGINVIDGLNNLYTISDLFIFLYVVLLIIYFVASFFIKSEAVNFKYIIVSMIYIAIPFALYSIIELSSEESLPIALGLFLIIWGNDTFAYLVGSMIGKHKMFPTISPKKSWEGFVGGLIGSLAIGALIYHFSGKSIVIWLLFAVIISLFSTFGDLFESIIKRKFEVKDSGNIIPGHGGMLDRFDSFLFAAPAASAFYWIFWPNFF